MKRRQLLRMMAHAGVAAGAAPLLFPSKAMAAVCTSGIPSMQRTLVNVMLNGGADTRFIFMPAPLTLGTTHQDLMYSARRNMYESSRTTETMTYAVMFGLEYTVPTARISASTTVVAGYSISSNWEMWRSSLMLIVPATAAMTSPF